MSYCRFGWDGSSVYVISTNSALECVACSLHKYEDHSDPNATGIDALRGIMTKVEDDIPDRFDGPFANQEMIEHLMLHRDKGDTVPETVFERLSDPKDAEANQKFWYQKRQSRQRKELNDRMPGMRAD